MNITISMIVAVGNGGFISQGANQLDAESSVRSGPRSDPQGLLTKRGLARRAVKQAGGNEARIFWRGTDWFRSKPSLSKCHSNLTRHCKVLFRSFKDGGRLGLIRWFRDILYALAHKIKEGQQFSLLNECPACQINYLPEGRLECYDLLAKNIKS